MPKKILIALDDSDNAMRAVDYVAGSFTKEHEIMLLNVILDTTALCEMTGFNSPTLTPYFLKQQGAFCTLEDKKKDLMKKTLEIAKGVFLKAGFDKNKIKKKMIVGKKGAAKTIIKEAKSGYDTVVMGRRGLSGIKEFIFGSVSHKVLTGLENVSILLIN